MKFVRDLLIIVVGLGVPILFIPYIPLRMAYIFTWLGLTAIAALIGFSFKFPHNVSVRFTASALFLMSGAALAMTALAVTPVSTALFVGTCGAIAIGLGYIAMNFANSKLFA